MIEVSVIDKSFLQKIRLVKRSNTQKQPLRGVLRKKCSKNMQQMYRRTPIPKSDFNNVAL